MSVGIGVQPSTSAKGAVAVQLSPSARLNIFLPVPMMEDLRTLAARRGRTMTDVVKTALGLLKIAEDAKMNQQKLVIANSKGKLLKEVVIL
jgi:hypothetical protein